MRKYFRKDDLNEKNIPNQSDNDLGIFEEQQKEQRGCRTWT